MMKESHNTFILTGNSSFKVEVEVNVSEVSLEAPSLTSQYIFQSKA